MTRVHLSYGAPAERFLQNRCANPLTGESLQLVAPEYQAPRSSFVLAILHILSSS